MARLDLVIWSFGVLGFGHFGGGAVFSPFIFPFSSTRRRFLPAVTRSVGWVGGQATFNRGLWWWGGGGFEKISTGSAFEALKKNSAGSEMGALRKFPQAAERRGWVIKTPRAIYNVRVYCTHKAFSHVAPPFLFPPPPTPTPTPLPPANMLLSVTGCELAMERAV